MTRPWFSLLVMLAAAVACSDMPGRDTVGAWTGTVDTTESGRLLVRNRDAPVWGAERAWTLRERMRVGTLEGDGADVFGEIRGAVLGATGDLYVLDGQASEVRVFGPDGAHRRSFGRSGQGPGELSRATGIALDPRGTLWVLNWGNSRYSGFDPNTGDVMAELRRWPTYVAIPWPGGFDRSGRLMDIGLDRDGRPALLALDTAFVPRDTLALPRADDRHMIHFRRGEVRVASMAEPFAPQPAWAPHPAGGIVVGEGEAYRLHRIAYSGDTTMTIEVERERVAVSRAERDSALAAFEGIGRAAGGLVPDRQPRIPSHKSAHGAIFVDDRGYIWVRRLPTPDVRFAWDVIDGDGRLLGQVVAPVAPGGVAPSVRGDRIAITATVDDAPVVIVFDIVGRDR